MRGLSRKGGDGFRSEEVRCSCPVCGVRLRLPAGSEQKVEALRQRLLQVGTRQKTGREDVGLAPRVDRLRACGNGVVPLQAAVALRELIKRSGLQIRMEDPVALRSHPNPDVQRILDKTGGKIVKNWLYELPEETMTKGFERLRGMIYWLWGVGAAEDEKRPFKGQPVPQEISEVMLWLRDHYGTDAERKAAMDRYMGLTNAEVIARFKSDYEARSQGPSAASTSPASSSSGSA